LYFNLFSASFCTKFLSAGIATSISVHVFCFLFLIIIFIIIIIIIIIIITHTLRVYIFTSKKYFMKAVANFRV
jgi:hypothetical protein